MAALNFPVSPTLNDTYVANNVIYTWNGEYWEANTTNSYDSHYVNVTGDNMTGDLTLGTDKITLDATDGSAEFAGDAEIGDCDNSANGTGGFKIRTAGALAIKNTSTNPSASSVILVKDYNGNTVINQKADGTGTFAGNITTNGVFQGAFNGNYSPLGIVSNSAFLRGNQLIFSNETGATLYGRFNSSGNFYVGPDASPNISLSADGKAVYKSSVSVDRATTDNSFGLMTLGNSNNSAGSASFVFKGDKCLIGTDVNVSSEVGANITLRASDGRVYASSAIIGDETSSVTGLTLLNVKNANSSTVFLGDGTLAVNYDAGTATAATKLFADGSASFISNSNSDHKVSLLHNPALGGFVQVNTTDNYTNYLSNRISYVATAGYAVANSSNVGVILSNGGTSWSAQASESRLKDIIGDPDSGKCWNLIRDIELKRYFYSSQSDEEKSGVSFMGPMADWLEKQDPELVIYREPDEKGPIRTFNQGLLDMKALQALSTALTRIEALEAKVETLKAAAE